MATTATAPARTGYAHAKEEAKNKMAEQRRSKGSRGGDQLTRMTSIASLGKTPDIFFGAAYP